MLLDFVPVHFARDDYALALFDGTPLYEYPNDSVGQSEWGTCNFMHSRGEVRSLDPARGINKNAVEFIRFMNQGIHRLHPTAVLIAEDSTSYPKVTAPVEYGGLGIGV